MFGITVRTQTTTQQVVQKTRQKSIESLGHAGAAIRLVAKRSVRKRKGPAPVGDPPHTHTRRLPRAIKYAVEKQHALVVIGPDAASLGTAGWPHEHGGRYRGEQYDARPFMGPALMKTKDRLPRLWRGSVR